MPGYKASEGHGSRMTDEMPRPMNHDGSTHESVSDFDSDVVHAMKDTPPSDERGTSHLDEGK